MQKNERQTAKSIHMTYLFLHFGQGPTCNQCNNNNNNNDILYSAEPRTRRALGTSQYQIHRNNFNNMINTYKLFVKRSIKVNEAKNS